MNEKIFTFNAIEQGANWISMGFGIIAVFGVIVLLYQINNKRKHSSTEIASIPIIILVFMATLLAASAFCYSIRTTKEMKTVRLSPSEIRTPFGTVKKEQVKSVYFYPSSDPTILPQGSDSDKEIYLIIEETNGRKHPLSSRYFDIEAINNAWKNLQ